LTRKVKKKQWIFWGVAGNTPPQEKPFFAAEQSSLEGPDCCIFFF